MAAPSTSEEALTPHSCSHCRCIVLPGKPEKIRLIRAYHEDGSYLSEVTFNRLNLSLRDVKKKADDHCKLADHILRSLDNYYCEALNWEAIELFADLKSYKERYSRVAIYAVILLRYVQNCDFVDTEEDLSQCYIFATSNGWEPPKADYILTGNEEQKSTKWTPFARPMAIDPLSEETLGKINAWLGECNDKDEESSHRVCSIPKSEESFVPSRLIRLVPSENGCRLRLVQGEEVGAVEYSALSYCWGGKQEKQLTKENLRLYETEIPLEELPSTLRDAVYTTCRTGLQYLWIDSMCIIQDDEEGKVQEIREMGQVYTHACLTIVDMRSSKAGDGFLHNRTLPSGTSLIAYQVDEDRSNWITMTPVSSLESEDKMVLASRGWALQEYVLSRRLIVFGTWSTQWICRTKRPMGLDGWFELSHERNDYRFVTEDLFEYRRWAIKHGSDSDEVIEKIELLDGIMYYSVNPQFRRHQPSNSDVWRIWKQLVEIYSYRSFSVPWDRTVALSGLAEKFATVLFPSHHYIAGLWEQNLLEGLLWHTEYPSMVRGSGRPDSKLWSKPWQGRNFHVGKETPDRPLDYRAPSWSWQAIDASVLYCFGCLGFFSKVVSIETRPDYKATPDDKALFGAVTTADLKLEGPHIRIAWKYSRSEDGADSGDVVEVQRSKDDVFSQAFRKGGTFDIKLDAREKSTPWTEVVLFAISYNQREEIVGLVLIEVEEEGAATGSIFRRLAIFTWREDGYLDFGRKPRLNSWQERIVHII